MKGQPRGVVLAGFELLARVGKRAVGALVGRADVGLRSRIEPRRAANGEQRAEDPREGAANHARHHSPRFKGLQKFECYSSDQVEWHRRASSRVISTKSARTSIGAGI